MFLKKIKNFRKQVSFKITFWHLALLLLNSCFLFFVFYYLYAQSILNKNHEVLEAKFEQYISLYEQGGFKAVDQMLATVSKPLDDTDFFIRIASQSHQTLYFNTSVNAHFLNLNEIEIGLKNDDITKPWHFIKTSNRNYDVEVLSLVLKNGMFFQIGKTVEDQDMQLERFKALSIEFLIFSLFIGGFGGLFLSNRMLTPLRSLIHTLKSMRQGKENLRVPYAKTNDELEDLTILFNEMLDHVETSNQAMRQTLDIVAHELRTPLTSIRGLAEVTLQKKDISEQEMRKLLVNCIEGIDEILVEFKMMTDITEVESGLQNLNKKDINLTSICQDVIDLYEIIAEQKEIQLFFETTQPVIAYVDASKFRRAIANLVDNAIKYSPNQSTITISVTKQYKDIFIKISDQGIGINENDLPHIWKRLYRGQKSRHEKGIGLGLSLVKSIIEAHKGDVYVEQNKEIGSTFVIHLNSSHS